MTADSAVAVDWMAAMDEQLHSRAVLTTEEAWAIAMTWEEDIRQKVAIKISGSSSVIQTYSWIKFEGPDSMWKYCGEGGEKEVAVRSQRYAEAIRATMLTWRALSSCPGFQVHENPIFWKHVLGELREHKDKSIPPEEWGCAPPAESLNPVKDARRMADDVLTRFSICFNTLYCRVVSGFAPSYDAEIKAKLESILTQLAPLVDEKLAQRPIRLKLDCSWAFKNKSELETLIVDINSHLDNEKPSLASPRFIVDEVCERSKFMDIPIACERFDLRQDDNTSFEEVATQILSVLHVYNKPYLQNKVLHLSRYKLKPSLVAAICSALPYARFVQTLHLVEFHNPFSRPLPLSDQDVAWLGYAIFHSDTATSSWKSLAAGDAMVECMNASYILQQMAQGNHLASILSGSHEETCSAYYSASFLPGTEVQLQEDTTPVKIDPTTHYDVCVTSVDLPKLPELVPVIVPGYGLGTVSKSSIVSITARPPSTSMLTSLDYVPGGDLATKLNTLRLFGANLTHLNAKSLGSIDTATVREILVLCPKLRSLSIVHDGSFWAQSDEASFDNLPTLLELELYLNGKAFVAPSRAAASGNLYYLEGLRLCEWTSGSLPRSQDSIVKTMQDLPGLRYMNFSCYLREWRYSPEPIPYADGCQLAWKLLGIEQGDALRVGSKALSRGSKLAFLSVVRAHQKPDTPGDCALVHLDVNALSTVFAFAGTPFPRECWVG
ncbi:hypothetical protein Poli38472_009743 [Pythium oligandrum]|uniref:Uncharacterized protein n=1 Tax=Pythium oligandrum TaxID=41045 RepID=A0A8K1FG07_PYTOL|nr:hypothetical protein Poli38472_009743 [Pythium oligandrum]|eukprot:TMW62250.1 hypothetical protein Poli38472_009743 [Pythium oligandrum]